MRILKGKHAGRDLTSPGGNVRPTPEEVRDRCVSLIEEDLREARVLDLFAGSGALIGYTTNNKSSLPDIARKDGRYRANLTDNTDNITLHFNQDQGRLDAKKVSFPFEVIARNIGIGTQANSQAAPGAHRRRPRGRNTADRSAPPGK